MANLRQIRTELNNPANFQQVVAGLGIDTNNFTRNLTAAEEAKIRSHFAGGEQPAQEIPVGDGNPTVLNSIRRQFDTATNEIALGFAAGLESAVMAKFGFFVSNYSTSDLERMVEQQLNQSVERLDLRTALNEGVTNPFLQSLNEGVKGFSLTAAPSSNPLAVLSSAIAPSSPSLPASPENSEPSESSNEQTIVESSL